MAKVSFWFIHVSDLHVFAHEKIVALYAQWNIDQKGGTQKEIVKKEENKIDDEKEQEEKNAYHDKHFHFSKINGISSNLS